jgi:hypothetical protein
MAFPLLAAGILLCSCATSSPTPVIQAAASENAIVPTRESGNELQLPAVNSWARSACYPRSTFYRSEAHPLTTARSPRPLTCSTCTSHSQAPSCPGVTAREKSGRAPPEGTRRSARCYLVEPFDLRRPLFRFPRPAPSWSRYFPPDLWAIGLKPLTIRNKARTISTRAVGVFMMK